MLLAFWCLKHRVKALKFNSAHNLFQIEKPIAYAIGSISMFWTIERISGFWS